MFSLVCGDLEDNFNWPVNSSLIYISFYFAEGSDDAIIRKLKNFYSGVAENEVITKIIVLLSSAGTSLKEGVSEVLQVFDKYKELWTEDKDTKCQVSLTMITYRTLLH